MNEEIEQIEQLEDNINVESYDEFFDERIPTLMLYVRASGEGVWHTVKNEKVEYIPHTQVSGTIEKLEVRRIEYDEKDAKKYKKTYSLKFRITLQKQSKGKKKRIIIQSGLDTWFTKSIVPRLWALSEAGNLNEPIALGVYRSDPDSNVVFGYIKHNDASVKGAELELSSEEEMEELIDVLKVKLDVSTAAKELF